MAKNGEDEKGSEGKASTSGVVLTISTIILIILSIKPHCHSKVPNI